MDQTVKGCKVVVCMMGILLGGAATVVAQFQPMVSTTGALAADADQQARKNMEQAGSNIRIGKVEFRFGAGLRQEYNDNIGLAATGRQDDFITSPNVGMQTHWPISQLNSLDFSVGLSYAKYWKHPSLDSDGILISPTSALDFNIYVGDIRLNVHDRFAIQQDPNTIPQLSNVVQLRRFTNDAGIDADWDLNTFYVNGGYDYLTFLSLDDGYKYLNQNTHSFHDRIGWRVTPQLTLGVMNTFSFTDYEQNVQNNSATYSFGGFADTIISEYLRGGASVSFQGSSFDSNGTIGDTSSFDSVIFSASLQNQLNRWLSHGLSASRYTTLGIYSNYTDVYRLDYSVNAEIIQNVTTSAGFFNEWFSDSPSTLAEDGTRWGVSLSVGYQLFETTRLSCGYNHSEKSSSVPLNSYEQNLVFVDLSHQF